MRISRPDDDLGAGVQLEHGHHHFRTFKARGRWLVQHSWAAPAPGGRWYGCWSITPLGSLWRQPRRFWRSLFTHESSPAWSEHV